MSDDDSGLPEEAQGKLEQTSAVPVDNVGPYFKPSVTNRQIFENIDDLYDYGTDIIYGRGSVSRGATTMFVVIDNSDEADLLFPNQPHFWIAERLPPDPNYAGDDTEFRGDVFFTPFYKKMVEWDEEGRRGLRPPGNAITAGRYKNVTVYLPDPTLDYSRPDSQTEDTTGSTTGTTVRTTTTVTPGTAGAVTQSETIPADVGLDAFGGTGATAATGGRGNGAAEVAQRQADAAVTGGRGNGAAEVARRQADSAAANLSAANVTTGTAPCLPNNPPTSQGAGSGAVAPSSLPYDDAILRQARAAAAAPASVLGGRGNGAAEVAQRQADATTAPTTVTQAPSTPTSSSTPSVSPSGVYIYEPLTPGFDRYDFNTGKKVYTPDNGPSRSSTGQTSTPVSSPASTSPAPLDGGIAVGTTTAETGSLLRQRREAAALSGGAG